MTKQEFIKKYGLTEGQFDGTERIEGSLGLKSLTSIPDGFNPTVGGYFNLNSLTSIPDGFNPTVGGSLDLKYLTSIPDGFNPTVGGSLVSNLDIRHKPLPTDHVFTWQDGKYIKVDGIFCEVVSHRGNVYHVKRVNSDNIFYIVQEGNNFAHGETLTEARESLIYKITERDTSKFKDLDVKESRKVSELINLYRVITGACEFGVKAFIKRTELDVNKEYSINEIIELTKSEYGHEKFKTFFK